jgi:1-acyl-sn-glycerol-3-phosphate acyltransferase
MIKYCCHKIFQWTGWEYVQKIPPEVHSFVMVAAPHTSNWDFIPAMTVGYRTGVRAKFVIKNSWLRFPLNLFMKPLGAVGIDREKIKRGEAGSTTDLMADLFKEYKELVLMVAPEGTRSANDEWKSGFWHIAQKAQVPLAVAFADFKLKRAGLGLLIWPTDFEKDMRTIMDFYRGIHAKVPENFKLDKRYS